MKRGKPVVKRMAYRRVNEPLSEEEARLIILNDWLPAEKLGILLGRPPFYVKGLRATAEVMGVTRNMSNRSWKKVSAFLADIPLEELRDLAD